LATRKLVDLQLALVEEDRVTHYADLVQRIAVLSLDAREPVHEHVVEEQDLIVEEPVLELLRQRLGDMFPVRAQARVDSRAAGVDVVPGLGLHSKHGDSLLSASAASVSDGLRGP
jgi:hypothetical protein